MEHRDKSAFGNIVKYMFPKIRKELYDQVDNSNIYSFWGGYHQKNITTQSTDFFHFTSLLQKSPLEHLSFDLIEDICCFLRNQQSLYHFILAAMRF